MTYIIYQYDEVTQFECYHGLPGCILSYFGESDGVSFDGTGTVLQLQGSQYKGMLQSCLEIPAVEKMRGPQWTVDRPEMVKVHIRVEQFL